MTEINQDQAHLDTDVAGIADVLTNVETEITALKAQPAAASVDFTGLDAVLARGKGDETPAAPAPAADPTPVPPLDPNAPAPADPSQPTA